MRDVKVFEKCVEQLERRFGHKTSETMHRLSGIVNAELQTLEHSYQNDRIEPLENLYHFLAVSGEKIREQIPVLGRKDKKIIAELVARALNAGIGKTHPGYSITASQNGVYTLNFNSRNPNMNQSMWWFYKQRLSIGGGANYLLPIEMTLDQGWPVRAQQPVEIKY